MANVLPPESQKKIWAMYRSRLVLVTALVLLLLASVAAAALIPSYVALHVAMEDATDVGVEIESERESAVTLEHSQALIRELMPVITATSSPVEVVVSAIALKPAGMRITRVMYASGTGEGRITFIGTGTREQVSAYKDILTKSGNFTGVAVPVGALVGSEGGGFSIVLAGQF
mgnify:CR=1 FL=1